MRVGWLVVLIILAGCSEPSTADEGTLGVPTERESDAPDESVPTPVEEPAGPFPMDEGVIVADGVANRACPSGTHGETLLRREHFLFTVPLGADQVRLTFNWTASNPTTEQLEFWIYREPGSVESADGASGLVHVRDVGGLGPDHRTLTATIGRPACGGAPAAVAYFGGVTVDVDAHYF